MCIFDPIQAFVPPDIRMGDRNAMRSCLSPLIGYGEKYGVTFLIIACKQTVGRVGQCPARKSVWDELPGEVDQIWAEAYVYWQLGEKLFLPREIEAMAEAAQEEHRESSGKEGLIRDFLDRMVPENWDQMGLTERRMFLNGNLKAGENMKLVSRSKICAVEIWVECFGGDTRYMQRRDCMEINSILASISGWEKERTPGRHGIYGSQRGFRRCLQSGAT